MCYSNDNITFTCKTALLDESKTNIPNEEQIDNRSLTTVNNGIIKTQISNDLINYYNNTVINENGPIINLGTGINIIAAEENGKIDISNETPIKDHTYQITIIVKNNIYFYDTTGIKIDLIVQS